MTVTEIEVITQFSDEISAKLPHFLEKLNEKLSEADLAQADRKLLETYLGEIPIGLNLILPHLKPGQRVLEIGSGIGALGCFLAECGVDIQGVEPQGTGFEIMGRFYELVRRCVDDPSLFKCQDKSCEELTIREDGQFDLIFSAHVLEHLPNLEIGLDAMRKVLKPGGRMVHLCPNYAFPYDPHFGFPVIFWSPHLTRRIYANRIAQAPDLWASLNFVSARCLIKYAQRHKLSHKFKRRVMADFFQRLITDPVFKKRHQGVYAKLAGWLAKSPLIHLLGLMPAQITSPMIVEFGKPES